MNPTRYRIGIDKEKKVKWGAYYSDYLSEEEIVHALALQIRKDLKKFQIYHERHGSGLGPTERLVTPQKQKNVIRDALLYLANADAK